MPSMLRNSDRSDFTVKPQHLDHIDWFIQPFQREPMAINTNPCPVHAEGSFRSFLGLELGIALLGIAILAPAKEPLECGIKMTKASVYSAFRNVQDPGELLTFDGVELLFQGIRRWFLASGVLSLPFGQTPIEGKSRRSASLAQVLGLLRRGIKSDVMYSLHRSFPSACARLVLHISETKNVQ